MPKLLLGNAPVREALLRLGEMMSAGGAAVRPVAAGPAKHSFGDSGVPKRELGHEGKCILFDPLRVIRDSFADPVSGRPFRVNRFRNRIRWLLKRVDRWPLLMSRLANPMSLVGSPMNRWQNPMSRFCNPTNPFPNRINRFSNPMSLFPNPMNPFWNRTNPFRHPMEAIGILSRLWHAGCGLEELQISPEIKPCLLR